MSQITLHEGDNRESLRRLIDQGVQVHSVVCDPPYGLVSVTKRFGGKKAAPAKFGSDGAFQRQSAGFMGSGWDGTGIERDPEFWALIHEILLPGGYCLAFSSPRTGHWQACAMEMGGFVMHPFFAWVYGSGFPKAHNAARAVDKELKVAGTFGDPKSAAHAGWIERGRMRGSGDDAENHEGWQRPWMGDSEAVANAAPHYVPGSPEAQQWEGWAYGGQSMKPALEPIYVGQKPFSEKNGAQNILKHGVGAVNIDACRVDSIPEPTRFDPSKHSGNVDGWRMKQTGAEVAGLQVTTGKGRHPANLLLDGSPDVVAMFPQTKSGKPGVMRKGTNDGACYGAESRVPSTAMTGFGDSGSAARFFNHFPPDSDPLFYHAKANKTDRAGSKHPTVKPVQLMQWLVRLVTPPGGTVLDPFGGSGTTGAAAQAEGFDCILMEAEAQFAADIRGRFALPATTPSLPDDLTALLGITATAITADPLMDLIG